jgi:PDZ domain-containing secreted protein
MFMMKPWCITPSHIALMLVCLTTSAASLNAQTMIRATEKNFLLFEVHALFGEANGAIVVEKKIPIPIPPDDINAKAESLKEGDELLMANKLRVKTAKELRAMYDSLKVGDEFKLLIKRGEEKFISSIIKRDLSKNMMRINANGSKLDNSTPVLIAELSAVIAVKDNTLQVIGAIHFGGDKAASDATLLKPNDEVVGLNAEEVATTESLKDAYSKLSIGTKAVLKIKRGGELVSVPFIKEKERDVKIMTK